MASLLIPALNSALMQAKLNNSISSTVHSDSGMSSRSGSFGTASQPNDILGTIQKAALSSLAVTGSTPELRAVGNVAAAKVLSTVAPDLPNSFTSSSSSSSVPVSVVPSDSGTSVVVPTYLNADLAKAYGMDAATAYQEALSNTSYQRAVADLRAAGLNPALISGNFGGSSSSVYGASLASDGISTGISSAAGAHDAYKTYSNVGSLIGAGIGFFAYGPRGAVIGSQIGSKALGAIGNLVDMYR